VKNKYIENERIKRPEYIENRRIEPPISIMSIEKYKYPPTPRPYWQIQDELATVRNIAPFAGQADLYLQRAVDAFDEGDYAASAMLSATYEDISSMPDAEPRLNRLQAELREHPYFIPSELGRIAVKSLVHNTV